MALWPSFYGIQSFTLFDSHKLFLAMLNLLIPLIKSLHNFVDGFEHGGGEYYYH
jgi:hypothetical protein